MLNFVVCDDNLNILNKFTKMLDSIFIKYGYDASVAYQSTDANNILTFVNSNKTDVLILDINLKSNITGLQLADKVRETN